MPPPPAGPSQAPYREFTLAALILGVILGAAMTAAFVYISLKLGFGLSGSSVAAIVGFAVLRGVLRRGTIVENNINQTVASGVNTASSGVAFTLPALFLMAANDPELAGFSAAPFVLAATAGSFLGIIVILPLRKQMIEFERLRFPSGIAVASLLRSPGAGVRQAKLLAVGLVIAALHTFMADAERGWLPDEVDFGGLFDAPPWFPLAISISFANFGAGLLSGRGGLPFVAGGVLAWWIISPFAMTSGWVPDPGAPGQEGWQTGYLFFNLLRPVGIGLLIGGALMGVIVALPAIKSAIKGLSATVQARGAATVGPAQELGTRVMTVGLGAAVLVLFGAAMIATDQITVMEAVWIAVVGTIWLALAGLVVAQATGLTDISPLSGMALIAVTLMYFLTQGNIVASIMLGVAVCIGIGQCADMMTDLKTGHLVGSTPRKQQLAQLTVAWVGAPVAIGAVYLFWESPGFGPGTQLGAPQAATLQAIIEGVSAGNVPLDKYAAGIGLGSALGLFPIGGVGVLVGLAMYLPFSITLGYGVGCLTSMGLQRWLGRAWIGSTLVPISAGFIVGEALVSLANALSKL